MKNFPKDLPFSEAAPLPVIPDWIFILFISLIILSALAWILFRLLKQFMNKEEPSNFREVLSAKKQDIVSELVQLKKEYLGKKEFREGLHELSGKLKSHFEKISSIDFEEMTYQEICSALEEADLLDLFKGLTRAQFGKENVTEKEMKQLYDDAIQLARKKQKLKPKKVRVA